MNPQSIIEQAYGDFSRGDIPALLARLNPEVEWRANVDPSLPRVSDVPCYAPGRGRAFVVDYLGKFVANYEMHAFDVRAVMVGGNEVAVRLEVDLTVRRTGKRVRSEVIHHWTLNERGEVIRFLDVEDTYAWVSAWSA
jgi:ketosteroid isomerase-like protein